MYNELLKRHEEILKKLTEKASKETGFDERGQFMNLQKMIYSEIGFINNIIDLIDKSDSNKLCAYKLGVGKIIIGQRGSGISSTLIDECLKYDRPLIVEFKSKAEQLEKLYPDLRVGWLFNEGNYFESNKDIKWYDEQVNVELFTCKNNIDILTKTIDKIRARVRLIITVGISYEIDGEPKIWLTSNKTTKKIEEVSVKKPDVELNQ